MLLAGDIGGTKTHLALYDPDGDLTPQAQTTFKSASYASLEAVVTDFLTMTAAEVDKAVFGVAGPVAHGESMITNLPWVIRETALQEAFGFQEVKLLNDLEATAYGIPRLSPPDLFLINDAPPQDGLRGGAAGDPGRREGPSAASRRGGSAAPVPGPQGPSIPRGRAAVIS